VFGCSTEWNLAVDGKQQEYKGWPAQPVELQTVTLEGLKVLRTNHTGKTLMINFWATWCGPCQVECRDVRKSCLWYRSSDFEFVSVSVDSPSNKDPVMRFLNDHHSSIRNLRVDSEDMYAVRPFVLIRETGVPFTIVLSPESRMICRRDGGVETQALRRAVLANLPDAGVFAGNAAYWMH
jgi:thiol-disulfide isomerase/thioredoxin